MSGVSKASEGPKGVCVCVLGRCECERRKAARVSEKYLSGKELRTVDLPARKITFSSQCCVASLAGSSAGCVITFVRIDRAHGHPPSNV